jgi:TRAP-type mannitol/chloroaromatic compound transport system permease small subunit
VTLGVCMQRFLLLVDGISTWVGKVTAWSVVALTFVICYEVFTRYVMNTPNAWVFDTTYMLYGVLFMMAGAYTLAKNGHVRGDILYGFFKPRTQAGFDLVLYIIFFLPGVVALTYIGWEFANESLAIKERSSVTSNGPYVYPFKFVIPFAGAFVLLQGIVEIIRCVICLKDGKWPSREQDVEEVDVEKLKEMVHVKDEDIQALDSVVVANTQNEKGHK